MKHLDIRVTGVVQGVFFRVSTQRAATERGVSGTVRNEPDGSVFIEAEGDESALDDFVEWCKRGPANAVVRQVRAMEGGVQGYRTFEITG